LFTDFIRFVKTSLDELRLSQQPEITRPVSTVANDRLAQHAKTVFFKKKILCLNPNSHIGYFHSETSDGLSQW
jgi:hypothetical protein